jgi:hypothetical protein
MKALIVYESMFRNTRLIAEQVGEGLNPAFTFTVVPVPDATAELTRCHGRSVRHPPARPGLLHQNARADGSRTVCVVVAQR